MNAVTVTVAGSGLAELTCAWLLAGRGHRVHLPAAPGAGYRPLLLNEPTLELLDSLWGEGLVDGAWPLTHRWVRWGTGAPPARFAQAARVMDGAVLAARMAERLGHRPAQPGPGPGPRSGTAPVRWTVTAQAAQVAQAASAARTVQAVQAARAVQPAQAASWRAGVDAPAEDRAAPPATHHRSGRRQLLAGTAPLRSGQDESTAVLDTTPLGWLQLTPLGGTACLVQAMVPGPAGDPAALLARLLAESAPGGFLRHPPRTVAAVPAAPRLHLTPAVPPTDGTSPGRLTVGAGAVRYDPLSGTGTAQALRTAILAAAVIDADAAGAPASALCAHYTARLRAAFQDHLRTCAELYGAAFDTGAWQDELDAARGRTGPGRHAAASFAGPEP